MIKSHRVSVIVMPNSLLKSLKLHPSLVDRIRKTGRFLAKITTRGHFHLKIGKTECIYSPVKSFTPVYL